MAWERLDQLRNPDAFSGWIRRLVLTQCQRRLRSPRLPLAGQDEAEAVPTPTDETTAAIAAHNKAIVQSALAQVSAGDRLVLMLFYGSERSHAEIAEWLRVPTTTVARRLAHAKRRLRGHLLHVWSGELRAQVRTASDAFDVELSARLRRVCADDASKCGGARMPR